MNWIDLSNLKPMVNVPCLFNVNDTIYYGWRRASDGKYEIRGYYIDDVVEFNNDVKWIYINY